MRVLSDSQIYSILGQLDAKDISGFQDVLENALSQYNRDPMMIPERIVINRGDAVHLFMPSFCSKVAVKTLAGSREGFKGAVLVIDAENGELIGVLNAKHLTAFRTALASTLPLKRFVSDKQNQQLTAFGNGLQSYWHIRLTLVLYPQFGKVQISVRALNDKSNKLLEKLQQEFPKVKIELEEDSAIDYSRSTVIFGCIPSTEPNIKFDRLNKDERVYISIIGSYKPYMFEVDDEIVQYAKKQGKIIVDSYDHTLSEAGELIKNGITYDDVIEISEVDKYRSSIDKQEKLILVKIVGLSIMDNCVADHLLFVSKTQGVGTELEF